MLVFSLPCSSRQERRRASEPPAAPARATLARAGKPQVETPTPACPGSRRCSKQAGACHRPPVQAPAKLDSDEAQPEAPWAVPAWASFAAGPGRVNLSPGRSCWKVAWDSESPRGPGPARPGLESHPSLSESVPSTRSRRETNQTEA